MPSCSAWGCSNRSDGGKRMHRFPRDPVRRRTWEQKLRREGWKANDRSLLCEDHFDETQYEQFRADNLRRLTPNAIPTRFSFTKAKLSKPRRFLKRHRADTTNDSARVTKRIQLEHCYFMSTSHAVQKLPRQSSDGHQSSLARTCRVCGLRFAARDWIPKEAALFKDEILHLFHTNIEGEDETVNPPRVCAKCCKTLLACRETLKQGQLFQTSLTLTRFLPHAQYDECTVCKPPGRRSKTFCSPERPDSDSVPPTSVQVAVNDTPPHLTDEFVSETALVHGYTRATGDKGALIFIRLKKKNQQWQVEQEVTVNPDRTWKLCIQNHELPLLTNPVLSKASLPVMLTHMSCHLLFSFFKNVSICVGNVGFEDLLESRRVQPKQPVTFKSNDGTVIAEEEMDAYVKDRGQLYSSTIRHKGCHIIVPPYQLSSQCATCVMYRYTLKSLSSKSKKTDEQETSKLQNLRKRNKTQARCIQQLQAKLEKSVNKEGLRLKKSHSTLKQIVQQAQPNVSVTNNTAQWQLVQR
ncbi:uncharacterized protein LOC117502423 [Thalassophryne amazonica]|uniref:uncharacterized protein LOC117502423 n=1 Tax=Thalassophryne amazonica TaxID=390379 RepID=UPI0014716D73|nr:uncharacterized protein LOC117502423 [Thalassophryne amazonica]